MHHARPCVVLRSNLPDTLQDVSYTRCVKQVCLTSCSVVYLDRQQSRFEPKLYYWIFIPCDIISLTLQATGGAMSSSSSGSSKVGVDIAIAGLSFQVFTLTVFIILALDYAICYTRSQRVKPRKTPVSNSFKIFLGFLTLAVLCILLRCSYRIDELSNGYSGPLIHNEGLFIGLEGV
jgi:hypothetical protein